MFNSIRQCLYSPGDEAEVRDRDMVTDEEALLREDVVEDRTDARNLLGVALNAVRDLFRCEL